MRRRSLRKGIAMVLALEVLLLLVGLILATFTLVAGHIALLRREVQRTQARYLAEAGMEVARYRLSRNPTWQGERFVWGPGEVSLERRGAHEVRCLATLRPLGSASPAAAAALRVRFQFEEGGWRMVAWEWLPLGGEKKP